MFSTTTGSSCFQLVLDTYPSILLSFFMAASRFWMASAILSRHFLKLLAVLITSCQLFMDPKRLTTFSVSFRSLLCNSLRVSSSIWAYSQASSTSSGSTLCTNQWLAPKISWRAAGSYLSSAGVGRQPAGLMEVRGLMNLRQARLIIPSLKASSTSARVSSYSSTMSMIQQNLAEGIIWLCYLPIIVAIITMLRLAPRVARCFSTLNMPPLNVSDIGNSIGYLQCSGAPLLTVAEKLCTFRHPYTAADELSREILFGVANDLGVGVPLSLIICSFAIRVAFFYPNIKAQINGIKSAPLMSSYMEKVQIAQMSGNLHLMQQAQLEMKAEQKKLGIEQFYGLLNIAQAPFLITWFWSLKHIQDSPALFPSMKTSFLWIGDISASDPYYVFPVLSSLLTSYAISVSPSLQPENVAPMMRPIVKYMKYMPLLSIVPVSYFPTFMHLCWSTFAFYQVLLNCTMHLPAVKAHYVKPLPQTQPIFAKDLSIDRHKLQDSQKENSK